MNQSRVLAESIIKSVDKGVPLETLLGSTKIILKRYGRDALYIKVLNTLLSLFKEKNKVNTVNIQSAYALDDSLIQSIVKIIPNLKQDSVISSSVNTSLLAGFRITYNNKVYDGSARKYINSIQKLQIK